MSNTDTPNTPGLTSRLVSATDDAQQLVVLDTDVPHLRVAVATTAEHGLQTVMLDSSAQAAAAPVRVEDTRTVTDVESFLAELARRLKPTRQILRRAWDDVRAAITDDLGEGFVILSSADV